MREKNIKLFWICVVFATLITMEFLSIRARHYSSKSDKINGRDLKSKTIIWGNIAINGVVKVHNDLIDNENIKEPDTMMRDLDAYNIVYNNSATNGIDNLKISYILDFQRRKNIKIERLVINIPRNYIKENPDLKKLIEFIDDANSQKLRIYGFLFDDYADGLLNESELKHTAAIIKERAPNTKIIGVYYYKDILKTLIEREESANKPDKQLFTEKLLLADGWFDEYTIWFWNPDDTNFEFLLNETKRLFPDKPVSLGIYVNDYSNISEGSLTNANPMDVNVFKKIFTEAAGLVNTGKAKDLYIISSIGTQTQGLKSYVTS